MFTLIESKEEIARAQRKLKATILRNLKTTAIKTIGYPGGSKYDARIHTDGIHWDWSSGPQGSSEGIPRNLNWFGLFNRKNDLAITVEINVAFNSRQLRIAGFFARDSDTNLIYLLHSGRVAGGMKGVGRSAFLAWSHERLVEVVNSASVIREGIIIMPVSGTAAIRPAIRYIDRVARFKQAVRAGEISTQKFQRTKVALEKFRAEGRGRRKGRRSSDFDYLSRHGEVVDALMSWRASLPLPKRGLVVNNSKIDLAVAVKYDLVEVFEVKTSTRRQEMYGAIGQLMVHGTRRTGRRVIVLPQTDPIADDIMDALARMGIEILRFKLTKDKAIII